MTDFVIIDSLAARTNKPVDFGTETVLRLASLGKIHITHSHRDASHTTELKYHPTHNRNSVHIQSSNSLPPKIAK